MLRMWSKFLLATLIYSPGLWSSSVILIENTIIPCWNLSDSCQLSWQSEAESSSFTVSKPFLLLKCPLNSYFSVNDKSLISQFICKVKMNDRYWVQLLLRLRTPASSTATNLFEIPPNTNGTHPGFLHSGLTIWKLFY